MHDLRSIPAEFWKTLSDEEWNEALFSSRLNRRLCRRLWSLEGRTDKPPHSLDIFINKKQLIETIQRNRQ